MANSNSTILPPRFKDITGHTFGKWTALEFHSRVRGYTWWLCRCECGKEKPVRVSDLRNGQSHSCVKCARVAQGTHGKTDTPEYRVWAGIKQRCHNPNDTGYARYGAIGITVCDEWQSFEAFYRDMGQKPSPKHTLERLDNSLGYSKENCTWATWKEQARNKRTNRMLTFDGKTMCVAAWAEEVGIRAQNIIERLRLGWTVERALTTPVQKR